MCMYIENTVRAAAHDTPGCQSSTWGHTADAATPPQRPKVPQSSAQPNERLGRVPRVNHSFPLARFQGRKRRKAPGYSPERFRSRELPPNAPKAHHPSPRLPDFKAEDAGRPRKDFLSQHPAARSARTLAWKPSGAFRWEVKPLRLSTCHHPADQR